MDPMPAPTGSYELPMFPLGSVLLPGMVLPLRVFEPRYRALIATVPSADAPEFGCVLIERGSEAGGGGVWLMRKLWSGGRGRLARVSSVAT